MQIDTPRASAIFTPFVPLLVFIRYLLILRRRTQHQGPGWNRKQAWGSTQAEPFFCTYYLDGMLQSWCAHALVLMKMMNDHLIPPGQFWRAGAYAFATAPNACISAMR